MPQSVVQQVHYLALKDKMPPLKNECLIFERRPGTSLDPHTLETDALDFLAYGGDGDDADFDPAAPENDIPLIDAEPISLNELHALHLDRVANNLFPDDDAFSCSSTHSEEGRSLLDDESSDDDDNDSSDDTSDSSADESASFNDSFESDNDESALDEQYELPPNGRDNNYTRERGAPTNSLEDITVPTTIQTNRGEPEFDGGALVVDRGATEVEIGATEVEGGATGFDRGATETKEKTDRGNTIHGHNLRDRTKVGNHNSFNDQFPASSKSYAPHLQFFQQSTSKMIEEPQKNHICEVYE